MDTFVSLLSAIGQFIYAYIVHGVLPAFAIRSIETISRGKVTYKIPYPVDIAGKKTLWGRYDNDRRIHYLSWFAFILISACLYISISLLLIIFFTMVF